MDKRGPADTETGAAVVTTGPPPGSPPGASWDPGPPPPPPPWPPGVHGPPPPSPGGRFRQAWRDFPFAARAAIVVIAVLAVVGGTTVAVLSARSSPLHLVPGLSHSPPDGYLYQSSDIALFIQWTQTGSTLSGTLQVAYTDPSDPTKLETATYSITGVVANGNVTLTLDQSVLGTTNLSGTFNGSVVTLDIPEPDGTITQATFSPATLSDYNNDVSSLQGRAQQAQAQAATNAATAQHEQEVDNAVSAVEKDLSNLSQDDDFSSVLSQVSQDLSQTASALTMTQQAAQAEEAEAQQYPSGNYGEVCADAGGVEADAGGVSADAGGVEASAGGVESALQSARQDITSLQNNFPAIATAESNVPQYHPANPPSQSDVNGSISTAQSAISQALSSANSAIDQANSDVSAAYQAADQAYAAGNCGAGPSAPQPQGHIS
jgi:hypothetical protein